MVSRQPFPYQKDGVEQLREKFRQGFKKPLFVMPTGGGKTDVIAMISRMMLDSNKRVLIAVHRKEIVEQIVSRLELYGVHPGIIKAGVKQNLGRLVQVASKDSYYSRRNFESDLTIIDEAHHSDNKTYEPLTSNKLVVGFTATPALKNGKGLGRVFDSMVMPVKMHELIEMGRLVPAQIWSPKEAPSLDGIHVRMGEFVDSDLFEVFNTDRVLNGIYNEYTKIAHGSRALLFNVNVKHSEIAADFFNHKGISAAAVHGKTPENERDRIIRDFKAGKIQLLSNCNLVGEGFDLPECETLIMNTSTKSETKWMQAVGRVIRASPGKTHGVVIDLGGCCLRFGMPEDYDRFGFSLDEEAKAKIPAPTKQCPECDLNMYASIMVCPGCGYVFPQKPKDKVFVDQVKLERINKDEAFIRKVVALKTATKGYKIIAKSDMSIIRTVAKICGYNNGWIMHNLIQRGLWRKQDEKNYAALFYDLERRERAAGTHDLYKYVSEKFRILK